MWTRWVACGVKDRELLALAQANPFDVFITADKNFAYQQNLRGLTLLVVILDANSTRPDYLLPLITRIGDVLQSLAPGSVTLINDAGEVTAFQA